MANTAGEQGLGTSASAKSKRRRSNREVARLVVAGLGLVLLIAFVLDNSQTVSVGFVVFTTHLSLIWVLLIAALLGALVDRLVIYLSQRRRRTSSKSG
jgi:uncharacterized integral membrane protein